MKNSLVFTTARSFKHCESNISFFPQTSVDVGVVKPTLGEDDLENREVVDLDDDIRFSPAKEQALQMLDSAIQVIV